MPWTAHDRPFLDPAVVARLGTLELEGADRRRRAACPGCTAARSRGSASSSPNTASTFPATISRTIDWKVYARSDRYYVKKFEEETNLDCHLMLDVSGSMALRLARRHDEVRVRRLPGGVARLPDEPAARRGRPDGVRRDIVAMLPASSRPGHLRGAAGHARSPADRPQDQRRRSRCTSSPTRSSSAAWWC